MTSKSLVVALCLAAGGTALAQPADPPTNPPTDPPPVPPVPVTPPPPTPITPPPPTTVPQPINTEPVPSADEHRPGEFSVGIGAGYIFTNNAATTANLDSPNIVSVRFRLPTGLTFEPRVDLSQRTVTQDTGDPMDDKTTNLGLGTVIRYPLMRRGKVDLELLGAVDVDNSKRDPSENDDDQISTTVATVAYGLAVTTWITKHLNISMSAGNPLLTFTKVRTEMGPMNVLVESETTLGAIFEPNVVLMVHLHH